MFQATDVFPFSIPISKPIYNETITIEIVELSGGIGADVRELGYSDNIIDVCAHLIILTDFMVEPHFITFCVRTFGN